MRPPTAPWSSTASAAATTSVTMTNEELGAKSKRRSSKHAKRSSGKQNVDELDAARVKRASCGLEMVDNDYLETADRADRTGGWNNMEQQQQQPPAEQHQTSSSSRFELWRKREERPRQRDGNCRQQRPQQHQPQQQQRQSSTTSGISMANLDPETASQRSKSKKQPSRSVH